MGRTYRTMNGRQVDMDKLRSQNELTPAVGNMKVNARGDVERLYVLVNKL